MLLKEQSVAKFPLPIRTLRSKTLLILCLQVATTRESNWTSLNTLHLCEADADALSKKQIREPNTVFANVFLHQVHGFWVLN